MSLPAARSSKARRATQVDGAQAAVAVQSAQRLFGGLDLSEAHRQECLCHQHLRIEAHKQDSSRRIRAMEGSCLCHWLSDLVLVAQPFLAVLPHATTQPGRKLAICKPIP